MIVYFCACLAFTVVGFGILAILKCDSRLPYSLIAAPGVGLSAFLTSMVSLLSLGTTFQRSVTISIVGATIAAFFGAVGLWRHLPDRREVVALALGFVCPVILLFPYFYWGLAAYPGSWLWDGWNYVVYGQFFMDGGSQAGVNNSSWSEYVAGSGLLQTRFGGAALIGLLGSIAGLDAQASYNPLVASLLFVFAGGIGFAAATHSTTKKYVFTSILLAGTGIWMFRCVQANNLDTLTILSIAPLLYGLVNRAQVHERFSAVLSGMTSAAAVCAQVELVPLVFVAPMAAVIAKLASSPREAWARWAGWILLSAGTLVLLSGAWLPKAFVFFFGQMHAASGVGAALRPGEGYFPGLFVARCALTTAWGFWAPFETCKMNFYGVTAAVFGLLLSGLLLFGVKQWLRDGTGAIPLTFGVLVCGAIWMSVARHYDYGAYKFFLAAWFPASLLISSGILALANVGTLHSVCGGLAGVAAVVLTQGALDFAAQARFDRTVQKKSISHFSEVRSISKVVNGPVLLAVNDPLAFEWAMYFLRDSSVIPIAFTHPYIAAAERAGVFSKLDDNVARAKYILGDANLNLDCSAEMVWQNSVYRLWQLQQLDPAIIVGIDNPNGTEFWDNKPAMWLGGTQPTKFHILSLINGPVHFKSHFGLGPSLDPSISRTLEVRSNGVRTTEVIGSVGHDGLTFSVVPGMNEVALRILEKPQITLPNGDRRPLLVSLTAYSSCLDTKPMDLRVRH